MKAFTVPDSKGRHNPVIHRADTGAVPHMFKVATIAGAIALTATTTPVLTYTRAEGPFSMALAVIPTPGSNPFDTVFRTGSRKVQRTEKSWAVASATAMT